MENLTSRNRRVKMPPKIVNELCEKVGKLEGKVEMLISQQKWQFGLLATITAGVLLNLLK